MQPSEELSVTMNWTLNGIADSYQLTRPVTVLGRSQDCDLVLDSDSISRRHARILLENGSFQIEDLDSSTGTRVNGIIVKPEAKIALQTGDKVQLGRITMSFGEVRPQKPAGPILETKENGVEKEFRDEIDRLRTRLDRTLTELVPSPDTANAVRLQIHDGLDKMTDAIGARLREYQVLQEITQIIVRILDVNELLSTALALVSEVLAADRGFIILYDPKHGNLRSMIPRHFDRKDGAYEFDLTFSQTVAKSCYDMKEIIFIDDALQDKRFFSAHSVVASSIRSVVCIPLQHGNEVSGVIYLDNLNREGLFSQSQASFLEAFACQTAIALENARLYTQAVTDGLTRLYNRKYLDERIFEEMVRAGRYERECSVILLDIDFFKKVNDTYGHDFGDLVLELVAGVLREKARSSDIVARYGGEEFVLLLTETGPDGARIFADRLRQAVEAMEVKHEGKELKVTISCGVAGYHPEMGTDVSAFVKMADRALYQAKETGRNKVCSAPADWILDG